MEQETEITETESRSILINLSKVVEAALNPGEQKDFHWVLVAITRDDAVGLAGSCSPEGMGYLLESGLRHVADRCDEAEYIELAPSSTKVS